MKTFDHPSYADFAYLYKVAKNGTVMRIDTGNFLKIHNDKFVRLSGNGKHLSIQVNRLMLLTYKPIHNPNKFIVVALDGNEKNHSLDNLTWGTRRMQSMIAMNKEKNYKRVQDMGRKHGKINWKRNLVTDGSIRKLNEEIIVKIKKMFVHGYRVSYIAQALGVSRSAVYNHTR